MIARDTSDDAAATAKPGRRRIKFGIGGLMLIMLICSVMASALFYLVRGLGNLDPGSFRLGDLNNAKVSGGMQLGFMLFTLASPVLLLVLASVVVSIVRWWGRR
ncbi:hypothetical protein [Lignipirellula cremea]|uniref:Uncharacterized protein n=1 Tax=Lignipirellula cremea TaxID=2528010 RepID=A0A518DUD9_9BACT|nr:hypothetical protein [Lignipirellula cremea]QDU95444.1 hypothetical protein Pla8534_32590 [Lignipirellula cremea]